MLPKIIINLSKDAYMAMEHTRIEAGEVCDYPASKLDDLLTGKVGNTDHDLYARYVDDDGQVRFGEVKEFKYCNDALDFYALADDGHGDECIDVFAEGYGKKDTCEDVGAIITAAYNAFKTGKYKDVTVFAYYGPNELDFLDIVTFE